ncbi:MAG TPA: rhodanese-related sulfurtransferase [Moheibacter sp.]|nr:rhodanese-related sulfurtransferase [Moheibacter sp.]
MQLWNKLSKEELLEQLRSENKEFTTISFYQYAHIGNPQVFRDYLFQKWFALGVVGRVYVAHEGINAQVAVPTEHLEAFKEVLETVDFLVGIRLNIAVDEAETEFPFLKLKIKVRDKILADGLNDKTFDVTDRGQHLTAEAFNALTDDPSTILIDMRNHYEAEVGHFKGAITPDVDTFRESLPIIEEEILKGNEDKNIVMYCTGGIRCEKASAWFKHRGFKNVHQLEGGIIKYANDCKEEGIENKFIGKNFVFDQRIAERISDDVIAQCHQCGKACDTHTNCNNEACHILFIQCESCAEQLDGCCSAECMEVHHLPEEVQRELRRGKLINNNIYKKGRSKNLRFKVNNEKPVASSNEEPS